MKFPCVIRKSAAIGCAAMTLLFPFGLTSCAESGADDGKLTVVTTVFASYDFAKQLTASLSVPCEVKLLLTPGGESHSYEPTPADVAAIQSCDLFVYVGGASEKWADDLIATTKREENGKINVRLFDAVIPLEEEHVEGMEAEEEHGHSHEDGEETEYDEHIWTSPKNAQIIAEEIAEAVEKCIPAQNAEVQNASAALQSDLQNLDAEYQAAADHADGNTLIFADRFPFRYLTEAYGWNYYAAFAGCSSDTDASAATLSFLISKVKEENIGTVFYLENSTQKISDAVCAATDANAVMLQSCNNVSQADFQSGKHYQEFMRENLAAIKEALG